MHKWNIPSYHSDVEESKIDPCPFDMFLLSLHCCFLSCSLTLSHTQYSWWGEKKLVSWAAAHTAREARHFPLWENTKAKRCSPGTELCSLGRGWCGLSQIVPLTLFKTSKFGFFVLFLIQWCTRTSPLDSWTSTKTLLSVGYSLDQCSPEVPEPWPRRARTGSRAISGSTARTEVCMPISQRVGWQDSSQVP